MDLRQPLPFSQHGAGPGAVGVQTIRENNIRKVDGWDLYFLYVLSSARSSPGS